jgi:hypothetical protein
MTSDVLVIIGLRVILEGLRQVSATTEPEGAAT